MCLVSITIYRYRTVVWSLSQVTLTYNESDPILDDFRRAHCRMVMIWQGRLQGPFCTDATCPSHRTCPSHGTPTRAGCMRARVAYNDLPPPIMAKSHSWGSVCILPIAPLPYRHHRDRDRYRHRQRCRCRCRSVPVPVPVVPSPCLPHRTSKTGPLGPLVRYGMDV